MIYQAPRPMHGVNIRAELVRDTGLSSDSKHCAELRAKLRDALVAQRRLEVEVARREEDSNLLRILSSKVRSLILDSSSQTNSQLEEHAVSRSTVLDLIEALEFADNLPNGLCPRIVGKRTTNASDMHSSPRRINTSVASRSEGDSLESPRAQCMSNQRHSFQESFCGKRDDLEAETAILRQRCKDLKEGQDALETLSSQQSKELARLRSENEELRALQSKSATTPSKRPPKSLVRSRVDSPPKSGSIHKREKSPLEKVVTPKREISPREKLLYNANLEEVRLQDTSADLSISSPSVNASSEENLEWKGRRRNSSKGTKAKTELSVVGEGSASRMASDWRHSLRS